MIFTSGIDLGILCLTCCILACSVNLAICHNITDVNNARTAVLTGYNKHTRPINAQESPVNVNVYLSLVALKDFDAVSGKLSTGIVFDITWSDESLTWDASPYRGVTELTLSQDDVWKPLLTLVNSFSELKELGDRNWMTVHVYPTGEVNWIPLATLDSTCSINTQYYPFDIQICKMELAVFGLSDAEVLVNVTRSTLDLRNYEGHALWDVTSTSVANVQRVTDTSFLTITFVLKRQPTFITVNFLIPILTLAVLNPLVFMIPIDSGERIGFSVTILLSLSVFMTILEDYIPPSASPMPLCAYMLMTLYLSSSVVLVLVIFSMRVYFTSENKPVNSFSKRFVNFCSFKFIKSTKIHNNEDTQLTKDNGTSETTISAEEERNSLEHSEKDGSRETVSWQDVSRALDRVCLVLMYLIILASIIVFVCIMRT